MTTRSRPWGRGTTGLKRLIRREVKARSEHLVGTVLSIRRLEDLDGNNSATWVVDVDVGAGEALRSVGVKAGSDGGRFYAGLGMTVKLARNTQGRFEVIGPGDRVNAIASVKYYTLGIDAPTSSANIGLKYVRVPLEYYKGPNPPIATSRWNDGTTPFPYIELQDGDGNPV